MAFLVSATVSLGNFSPSFAEITKKNPGDSGKTEAVSGVAERISKSAETLAKRKLSAYALSRYSQAPVPTRERFAKNFESVAKTDPTAEIHPAYLIQLERKILSAPAFKEDGALFWAYVHVLLSLRDSKADVGAMAALRKAELSEMLEKASMGDLPAENPERKREAFETLEAVAVNAWSSDQVSRMRNVIDERQIGPETRYFRAYAVARSELKERRGTIRLKTEIPHEKQQWSLSCEANSMRDFVNYYRISQGAWALPESSFVFMIPSDPTPLRHENGVRIWGNPNRAFVGKMNGRQSSNPNKLTGYGIHADGLLPYLRRELKKYGLQAEKGTFEQNRILRSLSEGNPVFFWYVLSTDPSRGFSRLQWKTEDGQDVTGFVGQHVGIIVGAKFGNDGKITEISYYEGKTDRVQTESFESISLKAKWFDEAIYAKKSDSVNENPLPKFSESVPAPRKKNVRTGASKTGLLTE